MALHFTLREPFLLGGKGERGEGVNVMLAGGDHNKNAPIKIVISSAACSYDRSRPIRHFFP